MMDQAIHNKIAFIRGIEANPRVAFAFNTGHSDAFSRRHKE